MKKILIILMLMISTGLSAQVQFSKFKLFTVNLYNFSQLDLEVRYKNLSKKTIKHVTVHFYCLNAVNERVVFGDINGNNIDVVHAVKFTGPIASGKKDKGYFGVYFIPGKRPEPFPYRVYVDYMDGTTDRIDITEDNIKMYFPFLTWREVDINSRVVQ